MGKFRRGINGNISELSGNRRRPFRVRKTIGYNEKGYQIYETIGYYATHKEAQEALYEYNKEPYDLSKNDTTLQELLDLWISEQKEILAPNSLRAWTSARKNLLPIENQKMKQLRSNDLQRVIDGISATSSKTKVKLLMNNIYKYADNLDMGFKNYAELLKITNGTETKKDKIPFTDTEIKNIFARKGTDQLYDIVLILLFTGMRPTELMTLNKDTIFLDENKIIGGIKTPAGIDRTIPISKHIKPILEHYMNNGKKHLFYNERKARYNYHNLQEAVRTNFNHTSHECRHTFSSNFYRTSVDRVIIKKIVGHKVKDDITEVVYVHKNDNELQQAINEFDDYMEKIVCF